MFPSDPDYSYPRPRDESPIIERIENNSTKQMQRNSSLYIGETPSNNNNMYPA
jgi:hypothetical protein